MDGIATRTNPEGGTPDPDTQVADAPASDEFTRDAMLIYLGIDPNSDPAELAKQAERLLERTRNYKTRCGTIRLADQRQREAAQRSAAGDELQTPAGAASDPADQADLIDEDDTPA